MKEKILVSVVIASWNAKKDIERCINSVLKSTYGNFEIIAVDNASSDGTLEFLQKNFGKKIRLVKSEKNLFAGGARDLGWRIAKGKAIFFLDQDNELEKNCISELVKALFSNESIGEVGPKMYWGSERKTIWFAGAKTSLVSSISTYIGSNQKDNGQFAEIIETGHIPNAFMVKKSILEKINGFDLRYKMEFEESDLAMKIKEAGFRVLVIPSAVEWHHTPMLASLKARKKTGSTFSKERAWLKARNRVIFMRKHSSGIRLFAFFAFFLPFLSLYYSLLFLKNGMLDSAKSNLAGTLAGILEKE